jgi:hypothetical protein
MTTKANKYEIGDIIQDAKTGEKFMILSIVDYDQVDALTRLTGSFYIARSQTSGHGKDIPFAAAHDETKYRRAK